MDRKKYAHFTSYLLFCRVVKNGYLLGWTLFPLLARNIEANRVTICNTNKVNIITDYSLKQRISNITNITPP